MWLIAISEWERTIYYLGLIDWRDSWDECSSCNNPWRW